MLAWERASQPAGSSSGPGVDAFLRYAASHSEEKGFGVISGTYTTSTFNLCNVRLALKKITGIKYILGISAEHAMSDAQY